MKIVRIALPVPLNRYFDYLLPETLSVEKGCRVVVPFGHQTQIGIVVDFPQESDLPIEKLKPIQAVLDKDSLFDTEIEKLLHWAANYYHGAIGEVLFNALPVKLRNGEVAERKQPDHFIVTEKAKLP